MKMVQLGPENCRWPIGRGKNISFCGKEIHDKSYCKEHYTRAYITSTGFLAAEKEAETKNDYQEKYLKDKKQEDLRGTNRFALNFQRGVR